MPGYGKTGNIVRLLVLQHKVKDFVFSEINIWHKGYNKIQIRLFVDVCKTDNTIRTMLVSEEIITKNVKSDLLAKTKSFLFEEGKKKQVNKDVEDAIKSNYMLLLNLTDSK